ncbi:HAD-IIA family hydrolase [Corynebacterium glyciniphilum]|uniref:HAD-IIA family hydrolase n=1 Tax=Corynebacterium glyciniphilum TaxID=1404244 RepID=UPI0026572B4B|nr:HAD-IIA family hydrolase [Corynebacterium glyciniphilum]MDN5683090.1 HAD-IIA family hydrolase [Corynebacterium glyciniphilum]MDN6706526.1 HAD-IIA family hydrolase [Corynebacterium glyciniphilum]
MRVLDDYDVLLADLDGTVFKGDAAIDGAREALEGRDVVYITNNASRAPGQVADHLRHLDFTVEDTQVLTSAQAACTLADEILTEKSVPVSGRRAYVVGARSFRELATEAGFDVVDSADGQPHVVLHGHSPENGWAQLSEAALSIRAGAEYVASNLDTTLPSERGFLVGNGSLVAAVVSATGVTPRSAGKPLPEMFRRAVAASGARRPLAVGDRLDTDIAGGNAAGIDTLCVLTGVATHTELLRTEFRPTFIAANLRDHLDGWSARLERDRVIVSSGETGPLPVMSAEAVAAAAPVVWREFDEGRDPWVVAAVGDNAAADALEGWR